MSSAFDPYHKWLGISPKDQPPNHYRLLGLQAFESNAAVISTAADQRMMFLRGFQIGEYSGHCQRLLNEVASAKRCLLDPARKTAYDRQLQAQPAGPRPAVRAAPAGPAPARAGAAAAAAPSPAPSPAGIPAVGHTAKVSDRYRRKKTLAGLPLVVWYTAAGVAAAVLLLLVVMLSGPNTPPPQQQVAESEPLEFVRVANQSVRAGEPLSLVLRVRTTERLRDQLTYSLADGAPAGAIVDRREGMFGWTPTVAQAPGVYTIRVYVEAASGERAETSFVVEVSTLSRSPTGPRPPSGPNFRSETDNYPFRLPPPPSQPAAKRRTSIELPESQTAPPPEPAFVPKWNPRKQGDRVASLTVDREGRLWVGTEDKGVWRGGLSAEQPWQHFTHEDGLGDNHAYALAVDHSGRIWAGHQFRGVSVFNGQAWQNFDTLDGPIGERVFDMAVCPTDGDVWIGTSAGLTRYSAATDAWSHFTRSDGLPSDQINAVAFDAGGNIYIGTECDGIAMADADDHYAVWHRRGGPSVMTNAPAGTGLPFDMINDVLVARDGTVYVATNHGLARSFDRGDTWSYVRGEDWKAMVLGLYPGTQPDESSVPPLLLREDYVTRLAEDTAGRLWIGHRQKGFELIDPGDAAAPGAVFGTESQQVFASQVRRGRTDIVRTVMPVGSGSALVGFHAGGMLLAQDVAPTENVTKASAEPSTTPQSVAAMPSPIPPPGLAELNEMLGQLAAVPTLADSEQPTVVPVREDWRTKGDWLGRIGCYWACLCAICAPRDYIWGAGPERIRYHAWIGDNHRYGDSIRYWVHWLYSTNRKVLEMPPTYYDSRVQKGMTTPENTRREAEWDDHGETYPWTMDGPHVYYSVDVPPGLFYLSVYSYNPNGDSGSNRNRDYRLSVRSDPDPTRQPQADAADQCRPVVVDDRSDGFETVGDWKRFNGGFKGSHLAHAAGDGSANAKWTFSDLPPGRYDVYATWNAATNHATDAPYTVYDGTRPVGGSMPVDQEPEPMADIRYKGRSFQKLGQFEVRGGSLRVEVTNAGNEFVVADAVLIRNAQCPPWIPDPADPADEWPVLAHGRIHDFWGGVYSRFLVRGPIKLTMKIDRNNSFNTINNGVFLDLVDELPLPYFHSKEDWHDELAQQRVWQERLTVESRTDALAARFRPGRTAEEAANRLFDELERTRFRNRTWWAVEGRQRYAALLRFYKQAVSNSPSTEIGHAAAAEHLHAKLGTCYYQLGQYDQWEKHLQLRGRIPARAIEKSLKWDRLTYSNMGKGFQIITGFKSSPEYQQLKFGD